MNRKFRISWQEFENYIFPDASNEIWLDQRRKVDFWQRIEEYRFVNLDRFLQGHNSEELERRLDLLDLSYLDPLTGILGQQYFLMNQDFFRENGIVTAVTSESIELINRRLGYPFGNICLYTVANILRGRLKQVIRISFRGRKFLILDDDWTVINDIRLILARTCLRTSDGYEIKGIGINFPSENTDVKTWQGSINSDIFMIPKLTEETERCDIYENGRFVEKIEGALLQHILYIGEQNEVFSGETKSS